ncbi:MAG: oligosaccharide flippase family protein [Methanoregula sp.]|nr:oligosaccharide flippase family protein [Methanoregula sp.]
MREKILELKNRIFSDTLAKGILIIASGTVIAQVIGVITTPIITRLYSPADFGVLGLFTATLSILALAGGFRYELALPLPKDDEDAANLFVFFLFLLSVTSLIFLLIIFLFGDAIASFFHIDLLKAYLFLLVVGFFGISLYGALTFWVTRRRDYTRITHTRIYQSSGGSLTKILLGLLSVGPVGLIFGYLLSQILGIGTLVRYMWKNDRACFNSLSISRMKKNAKQYIQFPLYSFPAGIINAIALQLPVFMLSAIYGLSVMGMYAFAYELLILPSSLISTSMLQVYYAEVSNMMRENSREIKNLYIATTRKLLLIGIPLIIIPCLLAPFFFPLIFGPQWKDAGWYCLPLAILALSNFVVSPTSMLSGYGFNHWTLIWDISRTLLVFASFYVIQVLALPIMMALLIYSSVMALMYGVNYLMNLRAISLYLQRRSLA